jgi:hypothetical protein
MRIEFIWSGLDLGDEEKIEAQSAIAEAITGYHADSALPPLTIHLFNNGLAITGAVIDRSGKQVIKITRSNFADNHTEYERSPSE